MPTKTSSKGVTLHKKVKLATGQSKGPKDDDKTLGSKKKGFRGNENGRVSTKDAVDVPCYDVKLCKHENRERRNLKSKARGESENEQKVDGKGSKLINNVNERKRVYTEACQEKFHEDVQMPTRKVFSKKQTNDSAKGKRTTCQKSRNLEQLEKGRVLEESRNTPETESFDNNDSKKWRPKLKVADKEESIKMRRDGNSLIKKDIKTKSDSRKQLKQNHNDGKKLRPKLKVADETKSVKMDCDGNSPMKKDAKSKSALKKQLKQNHNVHAAEFIRKSWNKKFQDNKRVGDDLAEIDDPPKKKKRIIRIDPYDISNKRLDDGIVTMGHTKEKKEYAEENRSVQMSRNAQFRAIKPTPSILSFVEDNLLGRRRLIEFRRAGYNTELSAPLDNIPFSTSSERQRIEESEGQMLESHLY